ncbi:MAG: superoxide dismutase family protein [Acidimicrobiales bacterium]
METTKARWALAALAAPALLVACTDTTTETTTDRTVSTTVAGGAAQPKAEAKAILSAADGTPAGTVSFSAAQGGTEVDVQLTSNKAVTGGNFHGIHVHANDDPANGEGCKAEPGGAPSTWFVAADGHLKAGTATHKEHTGDLSSVLVHKDGTASLRFTTDRFTPSEVIGKAVIVHANADNFGNIPAGTLPDQYTANAEAATTKTAATGNAGDRMACGLVNKA